MLGRCVVACSNAAMMAEKDRAYIVFGIENATKRRLGTTVQLSAQRKGGENLHNWLTLRWVPF